MILLPLVVSLAVTPQTALDQALTRWGTPACGRPTISVDEYPWPQPKYVAGWVESISAPDCVIHITPFGLEFYPCESVEHELRHLLGQEHDPTGMTGPEPALVRRGWCHPQATFHVPFDVWDNATAYP